MDADRALRHGIGAAQLAAGCLIGALTFLAVVPTSALRAGADGFAATDDQRTYIASWRYFVWDEWRWPLTRAAGLGSAEGRRSCSPTRSAVRDRLARRAPRSPNNFSPSGWECATSCGGWQRWLPYGCGEDRPRPVS
jgi:hypothetical protein